VQCQLNCRASKSASYRSLCNLQLDDFALRVYIRRISSLSADVSTNPHPPAQLTVLILSIVKALTPSRAWNPHVLVTFIYIG
jgi:hypothetical protein